MKKDKIDLLLSMQEHPEKYSDEQLKQMLANDPELAELMEQLAQTKRALMKQEVNEEAVDIDSEWQKFVGEHAAEMASQTSKEMQEPTVPTGRRLLSILPKKAAAGIVGILLMAGVAFAAIHVVRMIDGADPKPEVEQSEATRAKASSSADVDKSDADAALEPIVFDNVTLEEMLTRIAAAYGKEVVFERDEARQLRFHFVWKRNETLDATLRRLNLFESITVELKDNKIIIE